MPIGSRRHSRMRAAPTLTGAAYDVGAQRDQAICGLIYGR